MRIRLSERRRCMMRGVFRCGSFVLANCILSAAVFAQSPKSPSYEIRQYVPADAEKSVAKAHKLFSQGNFKAALEELEGAVRLAPNYGDAYNEMGRCYIALDDLPKAEESFVTATQFSTTVYPALNLADLYARTSRSDQARLILGEAAPKYPERGDAYYAQAVIEFREERFDEAKKFARMAHAFIHRIADVHLLLAKILSRQGNQTAVLAELQTYVKEASNTPQRRKIQELLKKNKR